MHVFAREGRGGRVRGGVRGDRRLCSPCSSSNRYGVRKKERKNRDGGGKDVRIQEAFFAGLKGLVGGYAVLRERVGCWVSCLLGYIRRDAGLSC